MTLAPLSAVVLARNEAHNIERCLRSLDWCRERVVVDDGSTDGTGELAAGCGARVLAHKFESFAAQRNWALEEGELLNDWVLMLDADETASPAFADAVARAISQAGDETAAFRTCRKTMFMGRWLKWSDGFPVWIMRVVRRGRARFVDAGHGEAPTPPVEGEMGVIHEPFVHYPFSRGMSDWVERHNRYSTREAELEAREMAPVSWSGLFSRDRALRRKSLRDLARRLPCRPMCRFLHQYAWSLGFLDGRPGLEFCLLMAHYERLIVLKRREAIRRSAGVSI